jgi:uncharacterized protein YkwD
MRSPIRRLALLVVSLGLLVSVSPMAVAAAGPTDAQLDTAEMRAFDRINAERAERGITPLRGWTPLFDLARERSDYMAETDVLSHTHAGGKAVWDMMSDRDITWYGAGEIIAYNGTSNLNSSASGAVSQWMHSSGHKAIAMSSSYNYVGFGLAISPETGRRYWTGVFLKGPDHTGAWAKILSVSKSPISATESKVTIRWDGDDVRLPTLTAGFKWFDIQRSLDGGEWHDYGTRTSTHTVRTWTRGHTWVFRVRAMDKAGNWGSWKYVTVRP